VLLTKKGMETFVLILKGEHPEQLEQEGPFLTGLLRAEIEQKTACRIMTGTGTPQQRLGDLHRSFSEALAALHDTGQETETGLAKLDHAALRAFLESGRMQNFAAFFEQTITPLGDAVLRSNLLKHYVLVDIALTTTQFISDLGGDSSVLFHARYNDEAFLAELTMWSKTIPTLYDLSTAFSSIRCRCARNDRERIDPISG
jgi:hypothetical protein